MKKLNKKFQKKDLKAQRRSSILRASCYCYPTCSSQCGTVVGAFMPCKLDVGFIIDADYNSNS